MAEEKIGSAILELKTSDADFTRGIRDAEAKAKQLDTHLEAVKLTSQELAQAVAAAFSAVADAIGLANKASQGLDVSVGKAEAKTDGLTKSITQTKKAAEELSKTSDRALDNVDKALDEATDASEDLEDGMRDTRREAERLEKELKQVGISSEDLGRIARRVFTGLAGALAGIQLARMGADVVKAGVQFNAMFQQVEIGFETMLGNQEKANQFLREMQEFAAETPFEFEGLVQGAQRMLAFGMRADQVLPTLRAVGDAVAAMGGSAEQIDAVTRALGQMQAKGVVSAEEMLQLAESGIPAWEILAEKIGVDIPTAMDMVSKRAVNAEQGITALVEGIDERFGGMMERQSNTLQGLTNTIVEEFRFAAGAGMRPFFDELQGHLEQVKEDLPIFSQAIENILGGLGAVFSPILGLLIDVATWLAGIIADMGTLEDQLERIGRATSIGRLTMQLEELRARREEIMADPDFAKQMELQERFRESPFFAGTPLGAEFEAINALIEAIENRIAELREQQENTARSVATTTTTVVSTVNQATQAFQSWQASMSEIDRETQDFAQNLRLIQTPLEASADQAQLIRDREFERVQILQREIDGLNQKISLTETALQNTSLTADEQARITAELESFRSQLAAANHDLAIARDTMRLAKREDVFGDIARKVQFFRSELETGDADLVDLMERALRLLDQVEDLEDGTLQWRQAMLSVRSLVQAIRDDMLDIEDATASMSTVLIPPTIGAQVGPPAAPGVPSLGALQAMFDRLQLERRAGVIGDQEFLNRLDFITQGFFDLVGGIEGLSSATDEQLELFAQLEATMQQFVRSSEGGADALSDESDERRKALLKLIEQMNKEAELREVANVALDALASRLDQIDRGFGDLVRSIRFDVTDGFKLVIDQAELLSSAVSFAVNALFDLATAGSEARRRMAVSPDPGTDVLGIAEAFAAFENLDENRQKRLEQLRQLEEQQRTIAERTAGGAAAGAAVGVGLGLLAGLGPFGLLLAGAAGALAGGATARSAAQEDLSDDIAATEEAIRELEEAIEGARTELIDALGIGADEFAGAVQNALDAASFDEFSENLEANVERILRQAIIQEFIATALEPRIKSLAEMVQNALLEGGELNRDQIDQALDEIRRTVKGEEGQLGLFEILERLSLEVEDTTEQFRQLNQVGIPQGFKIQTARFQTMLPIDADSFATMAAQVRQGDIVLQFNRDVYGMDDFRDVVTGMIAEADRQQGLSRTGLTRGTRRR